jgi:hypothetical protein
MGVKAGRQISTFKKAMAKPVEMKKKVHFGPEVEKMEWREFKAN